MNGIEDKLAEEHAKLVDLLKYVEELAKLHDKVVFDIASYNQHVFHENSFAGLPGIHFGTMADEDAPWLAIERLQRNPPPAVPEAVSPWLSVSRDPGDDPEPVPLRVVHVPVEQAEEWLAAGIVTPDDILPAKKALPNRAQDQCRDVTLRLSLQPDIQAGIEAYVGQQWRPWAEAEKPRRRVIAIYDKLFSIQRTIRGDSGSRPLRLVWGMGFGLWKHEKETLSHPFIEQAVDIELDDSSRIEIRRADSDPSFHFGPFEELQIAGVHELRRRCEEIAKDEAVPALSPFDRPSFEPVLRAAAQLLDPGAIYMPDHARSHDDRNLPRPDATLRFTDHWAIYVKPRDENIVSRDVERLIDKISEAEPLPEAVRRFVNDPSDKPSGQGGSGTGGRGDGGAVDERFFFPKPFNTEQQEIVRRLARADGVVVQGPPGTGKTHTIANLVCHYLAMGKRILITSKGEGALEVLRGHLPEDIRDLAVALLTTERKELGQLERTVSLLASTVAQKDSLALDRAIEDHERKIDAIDAQIAAIDHELAEFALKHLKPMKLDDGRQMLPEELALSMVEDSDLHAWLPDRPGFEEAFEPRIDDAQIAEARDLRLQLGDDLRHASATLPSAADLPDDGRMAAIHRDLARAALIDADVRGGDMPLLAMGEPDAVARLERLREELAGFLAKLGFVRNTPWANALLERFSVNPEATARERDLLSTRRDQLGQLEEAQGGLAEATVHLPPGAETNIELLRAAERASQGGKATGLFDFSLRRVIGEITVNRRPVKDQAAWEQVYFHLYFRTQLEELRESWSALGVLGVPPLGKSAEDALGRISTMRRELQSILDVHEDRPRLERELRMLFPAGTGPGTGLTGAGELRVLLEQLERASARYRLEDSRQEKARLLERLRDCSGSAADDLRSLLIERWGDPAEKEDDLVERYRQVRHEIERQRQLHPAFAKLRDIAAAIRSMGAPDWADALLQEPAGNQNDTLTPGHWRESWNWWRQNAYLRAIDGRERIKRLSEDRAIADQRRANLYNDLVRDRSYRGLKIAMTDRILASLQKFLAAIRRIGKGTGKSAAVWRREARKALGDASGAVPCWIMPHWRVSESLPPEIGAFDLVIVDEASQSDLSALPAVLRGRKVLIVGDDKQVSPTASFIPQRLLEQLRKNFLEDKFFGSLMLPGNSLYDLALAVFPADKLMLREHFRCVEPIIRFSMQFYPSPDGQDPLIPVRVPRASERLDPPLIAIHVPHGRKSPSNINKAEAEVIVDEIESVTSDPAMKGRTIGVVSLLGSKQAQYIQSRLLERLGDKPFERHDIACGDSATFQGKERDIMFVSMVECAKTARSKSADMFQQRFNVALSRARDRMVLVYSVDEGRLKPGDLKSKVLRHFRDPMPYPTGAVDDPFELCDSEFERRVLRFLLNRGYRATPQVRVGAYSIDIVVEGAEDRRLAIELDGDHWHGPDRWQDDLFRQRVLERCGWRFWRCWGSSYHLDPEGCHADLERTLEAMGIMPDTEDGWSQTVYTAFRTAGLPGKSADDETPGLETIVAAEKAIEPARRTQQTQDLFSLAPAPRRREGDDESDKEGTIQIGDSFVMKYLDQPDKLHNFTMTSDKHDPEAGLVWAKHDIFSQFIGVGEEDEVDIEIDGKMHTAVILKLDKASSSGAAIAAE